MLFVVNAYTDLKSGETIEYDYALVHNTLEETLTATNTLTFIDNNVLLGAPLATPKGSRVVATFRLSCQNFFRNISAVLGNNYFGVRNASGVVSWYIMRSGLYEYHENIVNEMARVSGVPFTTTYSTAGTPILNIPVGYSVLFPCSNFDAPSCMNQTLKFTETIGNQTVKVYNTNETSLKALRANKSVYYNVNNID